VPDPRPLTFAVYRRLPTRLRRAVVRLITPSFTVGSICVVARDDGRILLVRHSYRRRWGTPGGLLGRGEAAAAAAVREAAEEVGLAIEAAEHPQVVVDAEARRVDVVYRCRPAAGSDPDSARPCSAEIVEVGWFAPDDLPELQFETAGALRTLGFRLPPGISPSPR
jgi:ADP-ribose pyrophosphatase YjhB (NUDIX family)